MIYRAKICWLMLCFACIFSQLGTGQLQLSDPYDQFFLMSAQRSYSVKTVRLSNGIQLKYAEKGSSSGIPVIFLHGYTDSWRSFEQVLPLLPRSVHAYALSQRGHGNSDHSANSYRPEEFASDVATFMKQLRIESAIIVGHSMGATIAQRFALDNPQMARAIVLVGSIVSFKGNPGVRELNVNVSTMQDSVEYSFVDAFQRSTLVKPVAPEIIETYISESMKVPIHVWKSALQALMDVDYINELKEIEVPALIIWGDKDVFSPKADQYKLATAINGSMLSIYENGGHAIHWEDPERFAHDLIDFINMAEENRLTICEIDFPGNRSLLSFY